MRAWTGFKCVRVWGGGGNDATRAWIKEAGRMNHLVTMRAQKKRLVRFAMCCLFFSPSIKDGADGLCGMPVEFTHYFFHAGEFHSKV